MEKNHKKISQQEVFHEENKIDQDFEFEKGLEKEKSEFVLEYEGTMQKINKKITEAENIIDLILNYKDNPSEQDETTGDYSLGELEGISIEEVEKEMKEVFSKINEGITTINSLSDHINGQLENELIPNLENSGYETIKSSYLDVAEKISEILKKIKIYSTAVSNNALAVDNYIVSQLSRNNIPIMEAFGDKSSKILNKYAELRDKKSCYLAI